MSWTQLHWPHHIFSILLIIIFLIYLWNSSSNLKCFVWAQCLVWMVLLPPFFITYNDLASLLEHSTHENGTFAYARVSRSWSSFELLLPIYTWQITSCPLERTKDIKFRQWRKKTYKIPPKVRMKLRSYM